MKVLVIQQRFGVGDMVIFTPYIQAISKKFNSPITLLAKNSSKADDLFSEDSSVKKIIKLDGNLDKLSGFFKLANILKKEKFDKVFIFNSSLRYKILAKFIGIKSIHQYPLFLRKDIIFQSGKIFCENVLGNVITSESKLKLNASYVETAKIKYGMDPNQKHIVLGLSASGNTKKWGLDNFLNLAKKLLEKNKCKFYLAVGLQENETVKKFENFLGDHHVSFSNLSIKEILPILANTDVYVGNDTSFMHLSAAVGVKSFGIFVDSPAYSYSGYSERIEAIVPQGETVFTTTHNTKGKNDISFEEVFNKVNNYLN